MIPVLVASLDLNDTTFISMSNFVIPSNFAIPSFLENDSVKNWWLHLIQQEEEDWSLFLIPSFIKPNQ